MDPLTIFAGISALGGLFSAYTGNKNAKAALDLQRGQANNQAELFQQTSPYYHQLLQALAGYAGLPGTGPPMMPGPLNSVDSIRAGLGRDPLSPPTMVPVPGSTPAGTTTGMPGAQQLPYTNVTPQQLGIYANPTDALRLRASEDETRTGLNSALRNYSFGQGTRGLFGSSIDAAGRAALVNAANQSQNAFSRQLAINAPGEFAQRLQALGSALNPGLGAGPTAAGIYGNVGNTFAQQGQAGGAAAGGALQSYFLLQALKNQQQAQPTQQQANAWAPSFMNQLDYIP